MNVQSVRQLALSAGPTSLVFVLGLLCPVSAHAATYYVATTGNDSNSCATATNVNAPKRNIMGSNGGLACVSAGDTLLIRAGTYSESIRAAVQRIPSGTSWTNAVTIAGYPGESVTLNGSTGADGIIGINDNANVSYVVFNNLILDADRLGAYHEGLYLGRGNHHIRFSNGEVRNAADNNVQGHAAYAEILNSKIHDAGYGSQGCNVGGVQRCYGIYWMGQDSLFDGNTVYHNAGYGIHLYDSGQAGVSNNVIRNNTVYNNGYTVEGQVDYAIIVSSGSNNQLYNNVIYGNAKGIQVAYTNGGSNNQIYNNTIYGNQYQGLEIYDSAIGTVVKNNIVFGNGSQITDWGTGTGTVFLNNLCGAPGTGCSVIGDPRFVNATSRDFHLQSGSPALDAGVTLGPVTTDYEGVPRPQGPGYDLGASETRTAGSPPAAPTNVRVIR
jgi:parallel beta-helix repeat protein